MDARASPGATRWCVLRAALSFSAPWVAQLCCLRYHLASNPHEHTFIHLSTRSQQRVSSVRDCAWTRFSPLTSSLPVHLWSWQVYLTLPRAVNIDPGTDAAHAFGVEDRRSVYVGMCLAPTGAAHMKHLLVNVYESYSRRVLHLHAAASLHCPYSHSSYVLYFWAKWLRGLTCQVKMAFMANERIYFSRIFIC